MHGVPPIGLPEIACARNEPKGGFDSCFPNVPTRFTGWRAEKVSRILKIIEKICRTRRRRVLSGVSTTSQSLRTGDVPVDNDALDRLSDLLDRVNAGEAAGRNEFLRLTCDPLRGLARRMAQRFPR